MLPVHTMSIADLYQIAIFEKTSLIRKEAHLLTLLERHQMCYICMNKSRHQCILKEMSQQLEHKTKSFRERTILKRNMKYVLTLENRSLC